MAQPAKSIDTTSAARVSNNRSAQVRQGVWIECITVFWMTIEASVAISVGFATHSVSLQGFGIDSIIELLSGGVLLWRLLVEQRGGSVEAVEQAERRAAWISAIGLFALAAYIVLNSVMAFLTRTRPEASWVGIALAIAAVIIMPLLWRSKLHIATKINSAALKADAMCSITCAYMSITLLVGLLLNTLFGWWWADPLAAFVLVYFIVQEGREALHEARTGETCSCCDDDCD